MEDFSENSGLPSYLGPTFKNSQGVEIEIIASHFDAPPEAITDKVEVLPEELPRWSDSLREDLQNIPLALEHKWFPKFSHNDKLAGRIHPGNTPHDDVIFCKGSKACWKVYGIQKETQLTYHPLMTAWRVADFYRGAYRNHRIYENLSEVFLQEK